MNLTAIKTRSVTLAERIERRIRKIPAENSGYISACQSFLGRELSGELLKAIANEAAQEAQDYYCSGT